MPLPQPWLVFVLAVLTLLVIPLGLALPEMARTPRAEPRPLPEPIA